MVPWIFIFPNILNISKQGVTKCQQIPDANNSLRFNTFVHRQSIYMYTTLRKRNRISYLTICQHLHYFCNKTNVIVELLLGPCVALVRHFGMWSTEELYVIVTLIPGK